VTGLELVLVGLAVALGLVGIVVPVLPGALLVLAAIGVWAVFEGGAAAWTVFAVAAALIVISQVLKYTIPGRRVRESGVPRSTLFAGALLAIVGFFVIPVVGLVIGFVLGVYIAEWRRLATADAAWGSTKVALRAVGLSMLIELAGALLAALCWLVAVLAIV
jgi:uncharacterized protein YqgC (DUF456 family)